MNSWVKTHKRGWHSSLPKDCCRPFPAHEGWGSQPGEAESRVHLNSRWDTPVPVTHIPKQTGVGQRVVLPSGAGSPWNLCRPGERWLLSSQRKLFFFSPFAGHVSFSVCRLKTEVRSARRWGWRQGAWIQEWAALPPSPASHLHPDLRALRDQRGPWM